ncbi:MAG: hypothetical protein AAGF12_43380, partial [Myxococcota bacterium]
IGMSGIDYRVVMISSMEFVRVPAPLGTDAERFRYIEENVQSHDGLAAPARRYADYADFLRPDSAVHFVIVTDDESERMTPQEFVDQMRMNLGRSFQVHSIASPPGSTHRMLFIDDDGCSGPNGDAADNGDRYWAVSDMTGGQKFSICTADWSGLFATLTQAIAVATQLPCRFALPEPPDGEALDRNRVNVVYTPSDGGAQQALPRVDNSNSCAAGGWFYENDDIVMCPQSCNVLSADDNGQVDIALGCASILN